MHDVDQWTYRLANMRIEDAISRDDAQSTDAKSTDKSFYIRKMEDGVGHLGAHLADELVNVQTDSTDTLDQTKVSWLFTFKDDTAITASSQTCANLMHRFVLMHVLRDWALIYAPDQVSNITALLNEAEEALDEGLYMLELPVKHRRDLITEETTINIV